VADEKVVSLQAGGAQDGGRKSCSFATPFRAREEKFAFKIKGDDASAGVSARESYLYALSGLFKVVSPRSASMRGFISSTLSQRQRTIVASGEKGAFSPFSLRERKQERDKVTITMVSEVPSTCAAINIRTERTLAFS